MPPELNGKQHKNSWNVLKTSIYFSIYADTIAVSALVFTFCLKLRRHQIRGVLVLFDLKGICEFYTSHKTSSLAGVLFTMLL